MAARSAPASGQTPRGTLPFFAAALDITWLLQLPAVLAQRGLIPGPVGRYFPLVALGGFGPLLASVLVTRFESGSRGVRGLFLPLRIWRVGAVWYVVALGLFAAVSVVGTAVYRLFGAAGAGPWLYPPENAQQVAAMVMFPIVEEPGWRGLALPRLQRRYGALKASLVVGLVWGLWHTMMFVLQGVSPGTFVILMANILAASVVFAWFYNRTRSSLLLAILLHVGAHLNNPTHALPARVAPFVVYTVALGVVACALVVGDRRAWRTWRTHGPITG
jgi:membrane protease YdiL (CAAX protease family)